MSKFTAKLKRHRAEKTVNYCDALIILIEDIFTYLKCTMIEFTSFFKYVQNPHLGFNPLPHLHHQLLNLGHFFHHHSPKTIKQHQLSQLVLSYQLQQLGSVQKERSYRLLNLKVHYTC